MALFHALGTTRLQPGTICDTCADVAWEMTCGAGAAAPIPSRSIDSDLIVSWSADLVDDGRPRVGQGRGGAGARRAAGRDRPAPEPHRRAGRLARRPADRHRRRARARADARARARRPRRPRLPRARRRSGFDRLGAGRPAALRAGPRRRRSPGCRAPTSSASRISTAGRGALHPDRLRHVPQQPGRPGDAGGRVPARRRRRLRRSGAAAPCWPPSAGSASPSRRCGGRRARARRDWSTTRGSARRSSSCATRRSGRCSSRPTTRPSRAPMRRQCAAASCARISSRSFTTRSSPTPRATPIWCCRRRRTSRPRTSSGPTAPTTCSSPRRRCRAQGEAWSNVKLAQELARRLEVGDAVFSMTTPELVRAAFVGATGPAARLDADALRGAGPVKVDPYPDGQQFRTPSGSSSSTPRRSRPRGSRRCPTGTRTPRRRALGRRWPLRLLTAPGYFQSHTGLHRQPDRSAAARARRWSILHPAEAGRRGLAPDDGVELFNDLGTVSMRLRVSDEVAPGIVLVPGQRPRERPCRGRSTSCAATG